jgi:hypothetical protein
MSTMAATMLDLGKAQEARTMLEEVLVVRERHLGADLEERDAARHHVLAGEGAAQRDRIAGGVGGNGGELALSRALVRLAGPQEQRQGRDTECVWLRTVSPVHRHVLVEGRRPVRRATLPDCASAVLAA